MNFIFKIAAVALVVCARPVLAADGEAVLGGHVVDPAGAAVPGAAVTLRRAAVGFQRTAQTDAAGRFVFPGLPAGAYQASATLPGFALSTRALTLAGSPEAVQRVPGSIHVLDRDTLESSRVCSTAEALRKVPGLVVRDEEGFGLRPNVGVRGLNPTRSSKVLLLEDGMPVTYAPYGDNASYYHPPVERFETIEVLKGSGQVAYGPVTVGGVINYITPAPPLRPSGSVTLAGATAPIATGTSGWGTRSGAPGCSSTT